jgi:hypothetical protein
MAQFVRSGTGGGSDRADSSSPRHGSDRAREYDSDGFFSGGTKTIANIRVPIAFNLGVKLTNASTFGIAANSPG